MKYEIGTVRNGTAACVVGTYIDLPFSSSARASVRGLVSRACSLGLRLIARGSTRPGRLPTMCTAMAVSARSDVDVSSIKTMTSQLAPVVCTAAVKLSVRGDTPASCADWHMVCRIRL